MIAFLEGILAEKRQHGEIVINVGGVGFLLACSTGTLSTVPAVGEKILIHTRMIVKEDGMDLYGFKTSDERSMFDLLRSVTGIGARTALAMLSTMSVQDLNRAISLSDAAAIARAPGVGKKTAQRIILELKDKVSIGSDSQISTNGAGSYGIPSAENEAMAALMSLGYSASESQRAIIRAAEGADITKITSEELIRHALKRISA